MHPDRVGIEKIWAYPSTMSLEMSALAQARDHDPADIRDNLLVLSRSVIPLWEDAVTLAVNAALPMLTDEDRQSIELIITGTESSVDQGKAISTYAHNHLGIQPHCRVFEAKQACYGGTAGVMMAANWVASGLNPGKKALVISTDLSRASFNEPYEFVMGAGAVAMLISDQPRVVEFELDHNGYFTADVQDTFRPTSRVETGNGEASLYCYIDALEGAYKQYCAKVGQAVDFDERFKKNIYHVPFGGITFQAHRTLLRSWKRLKKSEAMAHFERDSKPGLVYNSQLGGTYSGSTFLALLGMLDSCDDLQPGDRVGVYAYGSGSSGEFYSVRVCPEAKELAAGVRMQAQLDARAPLTVAQYEALEQQRFDLIDAGDFVPDTSGLDDLWARKYEDQGLLTLRGIKAYYREYGLS